MAEVQLPKIKNILITALFGFVFSVAVGLIFYHQDLTLSNPFIYHSVIIGLTGAFVFSALQFSNLTDSLVALLIMYILNWAIFERTTNFLFLLRDAVFWISLWISIFYYQRWWFSRLKRYRFFRALALAAIYGVVNAIFGGILLLVHIFIYKQSFPNYISLLMNYLRMGVITGLGLGIGFDFAGLLLNRGKLQKE